MSDKDILVGSLGSQITIPQSHPGKLQTFYLVKLLPESNSKNKSNKMFIAVGDANLNTSFIHVKGFFSDRTEDDISTSYKEIAATVQISDHLEMWIPWHLIHSIRSLIFRSLIKK